jgi:hypothetical protein
MRSTTWQARRDERAFEVRRTILITGTAGLLISAVAAVADHRMRSTGSGARSAAALPSSSSDHARPGDERDGESAGPFSVLVQRARKPAPVAAPLPPPPPPIPAGPEAVAATEASCARTFHEELRKISAKVPDMIAAARAMKTSIAGAPGRLMFSSAGAGKVRAPTIERVCAERVIKRGRERCARWESRVIGPSPLVRRPRTDASPEEVKLFRSMEETIRAKGSLIEFGSNGRYTVMSDRFSSDMRGYLAQPFHPALCSGAPDLIKFYFDTLGPLRARLKVVADLGRRARSSARLRLDVAEALLAQPRTEMTPAADDGAPSPPPLPRPVEADTVSTMITRLAEIAAPRDTSAAVLAIEGDIGRLALLQTWLGEESSRSLSAAARDALLLALRSLEIGAYVESMQRRYQVLDETLLATLARLSEAERRSCTCGSQ